MELEEVAKSNIPLEILNPVNRLIRPVLNAKMSDEKLASESFVAQRFTHCEGASYKSYYYLNESIENTQLRDMKKYFATIKENADGIRSIRNFTDIVAAYDNEFKSATTSCYKYLKDKHLIIESFNDAAYPLIGAEDCEIVFCISYCLILQFNKKRYFDAVNLLKTNKSKLKIKTSEVYSDSLISNRFNIEPLSEKEIDDLEKLEHNYSVIIDNIYS